MTRKDFELIAQAIYDNRDGTAADVAGTLAARLRNTNPRFDAHRFIRACLHRGDAA